VISSGPSNPANRSRWDPGRPSLYARIQRTSSRLPAKAPNPWLKPRCMTSSRVPVPELT
jgi:hypothetical protein